MHPGLTLEKRIAAEIASYDGQMAVYVDDLKGNVIEIGVDETFETASTVKTYILATLFHEIELGHTSLDEKMIYEEKHFVDGSGLFRNLSFGAEFYIRDVAMMMIIVSDNVATNMMIDFLGIDTINAYIQELGCKNTVLHNPINFVKYDKLGTTTPREYASMFTRLAKRELVSEKASEQMLDIFKRQHYNSMLTKYFPQALLDTEDLGGEELIYVASKSGSMDEVRADGGIVHTPYGDYVIAIFNKNFHDPVYHSDHSATLFGARVSRMVFDQYLALEGRLVL